jgi:hypothetical protein
MFEAGRLTRLDLEGNSSIRTVDGFGIGASASGLRARYRARLRIRKGDPDYEGPGLNLYLWDRSGKHGLRFVADTHGKIWTIFAGTSSIEYSESCS